MNGKPTHGMSRHPRYPIWLAMVQRCHSTGHPAYPRYGGRGITVYGPWRLDPLAYIKWVEQNLGPRPGKASIDRINNDGHYEPGNLRWATPQEQTHNSRSVVLTAEDVADIRRRWSEGGDSQTTLARWYGVSRRTIGFIISGERWKQDPNQPITK